MYFSKLIITFLPLVSGFFNYNGANMPTEFPFNSIEMAPYHPKIHGYSNIGLMGDIHAQGVPFATKVIDTLAYSGRNIRKEIAVRLFKQSDSNAEVIDIGSSTGMFTKCLWDAGFKNLSAFDASPEMLKYAKKRLPKEINLYLGNAGLAVPEADIYVCGFVMHELPSIARKAIISNIYEKVRPGGQLLVVDIHQTYIPKEVMLQGEPFCLDYIENFDKELRASDFTVKSKTWIENHVQTWWCQKV